MAAANAGETREEWMKRMQEEAKNTKLAYGMVKPENRGPPAGYKAVQADHHLVPAGTILADDELTFTQQPSHPMNATLSQFPDGWSECILSGKTKRRLLSTPGYPKPITRPPSIRYEIKDSDPEKGLGMFATRDLMMGDLIIAERGLLVVPVAPRAFVNLGAGASLEQLMQTQLWEWERQLQVAFQRMPKQNQDAFMELFNSHEHDGSGPLMGRNRTNGFCLDGMEDLKGPTGMYVGIFKDLSRINHSCRPNTQRRWNMASFSMELYAGRPIKKGEEITTQYCVITENFDKRQRELEPYGVQCTCPACNLGPLYDSIRISLILSSSEAVDHFDVHKSDSALAIKTEKRIAVFEDEGLQILKRYGDELKMAMEIYVAMGNEEKAVKYGTLLGAWMVPRTGSDLFLKRLADPATHRASKTWGIRKVKSQKKN